MNALPAVMTLAALLTLGFNAAIPEEPVQDDPPVVETSSTPKADDVPDPGPKRWRDQTYPKQREVWDAMEGRRAPPLKPLEAWVNSEPRNWKNLHGKVVLIHYWAAWAEPAIDSLVRMQELHRRYSRDGLVVLGVHAMRGWKKAEAKVRERRLPYPCAADPKGLLGGTLGIQLVPTYYVVDRGGRMRVAGAKDKQLEDIVQAMLIEPTPEYVEPEPEAAEWPAIVEKDLHGKDFRGQKLPDFVVEEWLTDEPEMQNRVVMLDFWATWCPPCREAIPELNHLQKRFSDRLTVIGISDEPPKTVRDFMKQARMEYPQAIDQQARMKEALGVKGIPHVVIVSRDGIVRWQGFPGSEEDPLSEAVVVQILRADASKLGRD